MNYKLETFGGDSFQKVAEDAKKIAKEKNTVVEFDFNGIQCLVSDLTILDCLWRDYSNAHTMDWKTVGPDCPLGYDVDTEIELYSRKLESAKKRKVQYAEYEAKEKMQRDETEKLVKDVILLIHPDKQKEYDEYVAKNSNDGYSKAVIEYGEVWARLMQVEISKGRTEVKDIADECQKGLGYLGITGFQYGCVVKGLSHFWVFGEELRRWHNKEYGVSEDQKGVVNPAILTIGG